MDRAQNQPCSINFSNNGQESHSSNEIEGIGSSVSEMNAFDTWATKFDKKANNLDLYANGKARNISLESQQNLFTKSEQNVSKLSEDDVNLSAMNTSNEFTEFNSALDSRLSILQQIHNLGVEPSNHLVNVPSYVSGEKEKVITNNLNKLSIFRSESNTSNFDVVKSTFQDCTEIFQLPLHEQNKVQCWASNTLNFNEDYGEKIDVINIELRFINDACVSESFEKSDRRLSSYCKNTPKTTGFTGNCGFIQGRRNEGTQSYNRQQSDLYAEGNARTVSKQNTFTKFQQKTLKFNEDNAIFSATNASNEYTKFDSALDSRFNVLQQGINLDVWPLNHFVNAPPFVSGEKEEALTNNLNELSISRSESNTSSFNVVKSNIHDFNGMFHPPLPEQNKMQGSTSNTSKLSEKYGEKIHVSNKDLRSNNDACLSESFGNCEGRFPSSFSDIPKATGITGNCGFTQGQRNQDTQSILQYSEFPQTHIMSGKASKTCDNRSSELQRNGEGIALVNEINAVSGSSSMNHEDQMVLKDGCFICLKCGRGFSKKSEFVSHYQIHKREKPFACGQCGKKFTLKRSLHTHLRTHTKEKPFTCDKCEKSFTRKSHLNCHLLTHTGAKPFACVSCGKNFSRKSSMKEHFRIHIGEKPFACGICGRRFTHKSTLNTHLPTHVNEKAFTCNMCGKSFAHKCSMERHFRIHTGEKPFACSKCGESFAQKSNLKKHFQTHETSALRKFYRVAYL